MPGLPEKRQSVRPPAQVLLAGLLILIALVAVWFAVSAAVGSGGEDCPAAEAQETAERCR